MSLSIQGAGQTAPTAQVPLTKSPAELDAAPAKPTASYGSTPAAVVSLSPQAKAAHTKALQAKSAQLKAAQAQALAAQAKALAIKNGHDPDGVQDGK